MLGHARGWETSTQLPLWHARRSSKESLKPTNPHPRRYKPDDVDDEADGDDPGG